MPEKCPKCRKAAAVTARREMRKVVDKAKRERDAKNAAERQRRKESEGSRKGPDRRKK